MNRARRVATISVYSIALLLMLSPALGSGIHLGGSPTSDHPSAPVAIGSLARAAALPAHMPQARGSRKATRKTSNTRLQVAATPAAGATAPVPTLRAPSPNGNTAGSSGSGHKSSQSLPKPGPGGSTVNFTG